jgi:hypothetical protein
MNSMFCRGRAWAFLYVAGILLVHVSAYADTNAMVSGLVTDPQGRSVVDTAIVLTNVNTGITYQTKTNGEGIYRLNGLQPGIYRANVSKDGFKSIVKADIELHVQDQLSINFALQLGSVMETITVEGGAPLVNTQSAAVSTVIDRTFIENLPLNGRSFNTLLQLTPGVVIASSNSSATNSQSPGQFSISGQRTDANSFTVDGVSANFGVNTAYGQFGTGTAQAFSAVGGTSSLVSVEALQEFRVETSSFAPEFGRAPGGQVILNTRSGTNKFHGGIYDYFRNEAMDANDWFADQVGNPKAPERHNDFGGFLGGPILKDKTFFFFSYEGARLRLPKTTVIQVPSAYARSTAPPALTPFLNAYPQPDDHTVTPGVYTGQFTGTYSDSARLDATSIRLDHAFSSRFTVFGRYNDAPSNLVSRVDSLNTLFPTDINTRTLTIGVNMSLKSWISNTVHGNYSVQDARGMYKQDSLGGASPLIPSLLLDSLSPSVNNAIFGTFDTTFHFLGLEGGAKAKQINFTDDLAISLGVHQLKLGGDYRAIFLDTAVPQASVQVFGSSVQDFISSGAGFLFSGVQVPTQILTQAFSLYGQDSWKLTPRFTLIYGVRWELDPAPSPRGTTKLASWQNVDNPATLTLAPFGTPIWATTYGNFAPRIGAAYTLTQKSDVVLRAGAGVFYDLGVGASETLAVFFPNVGFAFNPSVPLPITNVTQYLPMISLQPPFSGIVGIYGFSPNLKLPRSYQWNVALEKSFGTGAKQSISLTYVGQAGRDLLRRSGLNQPNPNFWRFFPNGKRR